MSTRDLKQTFHIPKMRQYTFQKETYTHFKKRPAKETYLSASGACTKKTKAWGVT